MLNEVPLEKLRRTCDPQKLGCSTSREMAALETIIGQERAVKSLNFGLGIKDTGFNIYVAGLPGTGRTTAVKRFLEEVAKDEPVPDDWCYVNNFRDPQRPHALRLPAGLASKFQADIQNLVEMAKRELRTAFESEEYLSQKETMKNEFDQQREGLLKQTAASAKEQGFLLQATPVGLVTIPMRDGKPLREEEFNALSPEEKEEIGQNRKQLQAEMETVLRQVKRIEKSAEDATKKLDKEVALYTLSHPIKELEEKYKDLPEVIEFIRAIKDDILDNLSQLREEPDDAASPTPAALTRKGQTGRTHEVNVLVDNAELEGAPVVIELNPTYNNLFGRIEKEAQFGTLLTDFTLIRGGSLHRANGGYLVITVEDLVANPTTWESLKRALANQEIAIEDIVERLGLITTKGLRPEPIPLNTKVLLIGKADVYQILRTYDEDFSELFKVKAEFGTLMDRTDENIHGYAAFVCTICEEEKLRHLDSSALAKIVEYGSRLAGDQEKLSTRFRDIADILREANYYAGQEDLQLVTANHITRAVEERFYRSNLLQERINELIERDTIMIEIEGSQVGQVNGLSVLDLGDIAFGRPSRITASFGLGREGLIDIEREANLGGPIHTKGVMIITGYLADKYALDKPLSLSARLVFEQSYSGVEGDSASSAELYALLSSLSGVPIKQSIAVTGSVNQKGEVQAIGGVNEKIEGYFEICKVKGLTGEQGVVIPRSNVPNLMLKEEVVEAVAEGRFHIWHVDSIEEGIEVLTGLGAGKRLEDGTFEQGTIHHLVDQRLAELAEKLRKFIRLEQ